MLPLSLFRRTFNIADMSNFGKDLFLMVQMGHSFSQWNKESAYLSESKHNRAYEYQSLSNYNLKINNEINDWQRKQKLNSGENKHLTAFLN